MNSEGNYNQQWCIWKLISKGWKLFCHNWMNLVNEWFSMTTGSVTNVSLPPRKLYRNLDYGMVRQFLFQDSLYQSLKLLITFSKSLCEIEEATISDWYCGLIQTNVGAERVSTTWKYACVPRHFTCPLRIWPDSYRLQDDQWIKLNSKPLAESPSSFLTYRYLWKIEVALLAGSENQKHICVVPTWTLEKVSHMIWPDI